MLSVFGSNGYIGSNFCKKYFNQVIKIRRNANAALSKNILYFISTTHNYNIFKNPFIDIETNLIKLIKVLESNKDKKVTINFISSWFVYGDIKLPVKESDLCNPKGFYSITKYTAEKLLISYCNTFNIKYRIIRLSNIYGRFDKGSGKQKNALHYLVHKIKKNNKISLYDNGNFYRDYLHVDDCIQAIYLIAKKGKKNNIYNVGSGDKILFKDIISQAKKIYDSKSIILKYRIPKFHTLVQSKDFTMNISKIKKMGFKQKIKLSEGLKTII